MSMFPPTSVDQLPQQQVQAYLDDLAAISARHSLVIDSGSVVPRRDDVGGYLLATGGYLFSYPVGDSAVAAVQANVAAAFAGRHPRTMKADIAGITAHDLIRRYRP